MKAILVLLAELGLLLIRTLFVSKTNREEAMEALRKAQEKLDSESHSALTDDLEHHRKLRSRLHALQDEMDQDIENQSSRN